VSVTPGSYGGRPGAAACGDPWGILLAMQRIRNSWELGKISWSVLRSDRTLAWFPVLSAIGALVVIGVFGGLVAATGVDTTAGHQSLQAIGYVFIVVGYIALAFVTTYFLAALVHGANERLEGRDSTVGGGLGAANAKLHRILPWAIVQGTVSVVIAAIEERAGFVGQIIVRLIGAAWAIVTFLTIPIIMLEDLGPWNALKRSGTLVKHTWGENIVAQAGFGLFAMLASIPGILLIAIGISSNELAITIPLGIVGLVWVAIVSVVISTMSGIYRTALYRFAVDGTAPGAFANADLGHAFGPKSRGGQPMGDPSQN
jgi:Family of unknown function (DUF6159)